MIDGLTEHPLRKWRKSHGLTLEQAASRIGTSRQVWCDWERRRRRPGVRLMPKVREATGLSADIFFPAAAEPERAAALAA